MTVAPPPDWPLAWQTLLIGSGDQHADGEGGVSTLAAAAGDAAHLAQVPGFSRPRGCPLGGAVAAGVFGQVVTAHEAALAHAAHKLLLARVCPTVAGQLVGACKLLVAAVPVAAERLLACRGSGQDVSRKLAGSWQEPRPCRLTRAVAYIATYCHYRVTTLCV